MENNRIRYERLNQVVRKAVDQTVKKALSADLLNQCFPHIAEMDGGAEALESARRQLQDYLQKTSTLQVEHIFAERDVKRKLDDLDDLIEEAQRARSLGDETPLNFDKLSANELIDATIASTKEDAIRKLTMIHEELALDNKKIYDELREMTEQSNKLAGDVQNSVDSLLNGIEELKRMEYDEKLDQLAEAAFTRV